MEAYLKQASYRSATSRFGCLLLSGLFVLIAAGTVYAAELRIGVIPEHNVFEQLRKCNIVGDYIKSRTGIDIKFSFLSRYGNIIESFEADNMDGAFWGSFTGAMALRKLDIEFIARPDSLKDDSGYQSYIFVHKYSIIRDPSDMEGMVIAFVDKATTAGYVFPMAYFKKAGIKDMDNYFKKYYFTGSHHETIYSVLEGEANVGAAGSAAFNALAAVEPRVNEELVVIAKSSELPAGVLGLRKELPFAVKEQLRRVLLGMDKDPKGIEVLNEAGIERFVETDESDFAPVFVIAEEAGLDIEEYEYAYK